MREANTRTVKHPKPPRQTGCCHLRMPGEVTFTAELENKIWNRNELAGFGMYISVNCSDDTIEPLRLAEFKEVAFVNVIACDLIY